MSPHDFIYSPGIWLGEGKITFNTTSDSIQFFTKWNIAEEGSGCIKAVQIVEMQGIEDHTINTYTFYDFSENGFFVTLENELIGKVIGNGIKRDHVISWHFSDTPSFSGTETYERQLNGDYVLHAEYGSDTLFKTFIDGVIWQRR